MEAIILHISAETVMKIEKKEVENILGCVPVRDIKPHCNQLHRLSLCHVQLLVEMRIGTKHQDLETWQYKFPIITVCVLLHRQRHVHKIVQSHPFRCDLSLQIP